MQLYHIAILRFAVVVAPRGEAYTQRQQRKHRIKDNQPGQIDERAESKTTQRIF